MRRARLADARGEEAPGHTDAIATIRWELNEDASEPLGTSRCAQGLREYSGWWAMVRYGARSVRCQATASALLSLSSASFDNDVRRTSGSYCRIRSVTLSPVASTT